MASMFNRTIGGFLNQPAKPSKPEVTGAEPAAGDGTASAGAGPAGSLAQTRKARPPLGQRQSSDGATVRRINRPPTPGELAVGTGAGTGSEAPGAQDSITLGQLKANGPPPVAKQKQFDFKYDDTDTIMHELDEFYPYVEMPIVAKNKERFEGSFDGDWITASSKKRTAYIELQLEYLESSLPDTRRAAQGRLLYLLQGCFADVSSPEEQLKWIKENAQIVRAVDGIAILVVCLRDAARRYSAISDLPDKSTSDANTGPCDPYDERSAELMDCLALLYFVVEVLRSEPGFGEDLMAMSPSLPIVLFEMIAALKDRVPKGYPVKKVLLLLWKTLLATLGGIKEVAKARVLAREITGLPPVDKNFTKASPMDITSFRRDISVKYPTFAPSSSTTVSVPNDRLAEGMKPLPQRPNYHTTDIPDTSLYMASGPGGPATPAPMNQSLPQPGTPAPTPPGSPAPKKKSQYQTDPTRPYVFPFSRHGRGDPTSLVPFAIAEADRLYHQHAYVSTGLYQMWQAREDCLRDERGLGPSGLIGFDRLILDDEVDEAAEEAMRRQWQYEQEEFECAARGDTEGEAKARGKQETLRRLQRVEVIYKAILPIMQPCVIVLLKLLLATVTGPGAQAPPPPVTDGQQAHAQQGQAEGEAEVKDLPPPTREEVDLARHREITSKAVSAILVLLLKWFKASHVLKYHYFAQLLFDSNCLLLVLKMFGLSDVAVAVQAQNEWDDWNFFQYCYINCSKDKPDPPPAPFKPKPPKQAAVKAAGILAPLDAPTGPVAPSNGLVGGAKTAQSALAGAVGGIGAGPAGPAGAAANAAPAPPPPPPPAPTGEPPEVELIGEYSWRNFFTTINFLKVLQKMTKHRSHRTFMLQQYKSSQIMKRMLRVNHPMLQLQVLKLIKSQMPWCGRKWRQTNMKVITAIYLNCRPELRDEWLSGQDQEIEMEDALPQEHALRTLTGFYNKHNYPPPSALSPGFGSGDAARHRRTDSFTAVTLDDPGMEAHRDRQTAGQGPGHLGPHGQGSGVHTGPGGGPHAARPSRGRTMSGGSNEDVFPPRRSSVDGAGFGLPYNPDGMIEFWLHEYEDVLGEVFGDGSDDAWAQDEWGYGYGYGYSYGAPPSPRRASSGAVSGLAPSGATHLNDDEDDEDENPDGAISPRRPPSGGGMSPLGSPGLPGMHGDIRDTRAWNALGEIMGTTDDDAISDSESIVTVGELGDDAHLDDMDEYMGDAGRRQDRKNAQGEEEERDRARAMGAFGRMQRRKSTENENSWADMATKTIAALPKSPAERRRSSSGQRDSPLRQALISPHEHDLARKRSRSPSSARGSLGGSGSGGAGGGGADALGVGVGSLWSQGNVFEDDDAEMDLPGPMPGPMPIERQTQDEVDRDFGAVDEVEYVYGE